jgi:organic hydroperoxide reductase OsmC/OhrA
MKLGGTVMRDQYLYETELAWKGERTGVLEASGLPHLPVTAPLEFAGEPGKWTPEQLLVGATASCLMTTFLAIAEFSNLSLNFFRVKAAGKLEKIPGEGYRFTEIRLTAEVGVFPDDMEKTRRMLAKAEKSCFISNSIRAAVVVEPVFVQVASEVAH